MSHGSYFTVTKEIRKKLKRPLGRLISNDLVTRDLLVGMIMKAPRVVTVGDATTDRLLSLDLVPDLQVVDGRERRMKRPKVAARYEVLIKSVNPAGTIHKDALSAIKKAKKEEKPVRIEIEGEEDLLALPIAAVYPEGTFIFYGQPSKGLVAVKVDKRKKDRAVGMLRELGITKF